MQNELTFNKKSFFVRVAKPGDAATILTLVNDLMKTGKFYLAYKLPYTLQQEVEYLDSIGNGHVVLVAENQSNILGWISIVKSYAPFSQHVGQIIVGVEQMSQRQGIGSELLKQAEIMALHMGIEKIESSIRLSNTTALNFFNQASFIVEGKKMRSVKIQDQYEDEILMAKLLR